MSKLIRNKKRRVINNKYLMMTRADVIDGIKPPDAYIYFKPDSQTPLQDIVVHEKSISLHVAGFGINQSAEAEIRHNFSDSHLTLVEYADIDHLKEIKHFKDENIKGKVEQLIRAKVKKREYPLLSIVEARRKDAKNRT